jgi:hypothetical protein
VQFDLIRRFTDGSQDVGDRTVDLTEAQLGLRFEAAVPGKAWEVREIIRDTKPLPTIIAELVDDD